MKVMFLALRGVSHTKTLLELVKTTTKPQNSPAASGIELVRLPQTTKPQNCTAASEMLFVRLPPSVQRGEREMRER
jgi:hypothetical protein